VGKGGRRWEKDVVSCIVEQRGDDARNINMHRVCEFLDACMMPWSGRGEHDAEVNQTASLADHEDVRPKFRELPREGRAASCVQVGKLA